MSGDYDAVARLVAAPVRPNSAIPHEYMYEIQIGATVFKSEGLVHKAPYVDWLGKFDEINETLKDNTNWTYFTRSGEPRKVSLLLIKGLSSSVDLTADFGDNITSVSGPMIDDVSDNSVRYFVRDKNRSKQLHYPDVAYNNEIIMDETTLQWRLKYT